MSISNIFQRFRSHPHKRSENSAGVRSDSIKVRVFSFAMAAPKPFHQCIVENWAQMPASYQFSLVTDCPELWAPLIKGLKNVDLVSISMDEWFNRAEMAISTNGEPQVGPSFNEVYGGARNGWVACSLRPLLPKIISVGECDVWGWIDWDVFVNPVLLHEHLAHAEQTDLFMFPREGFMWEHFKLFKTGVDLLPIARRVMAEGTANATAPMCAMTSYAIGAAEYSYRRDGLAQEMIAVHWAYSDKMQAKNGVPVIQYRDGYMTDGAGHPLMFFVADTQVKDWSETDMNEYRETISTKGQFFFDFVPKLS